MATLEDAVDSALPVLRKLDARLAVVIERLEDAAEAIEEVARSVDEAWTPFEAAARSLLQAIPGHEASLREAAQSAREALDDAPLVDASGGGGVELAVSVSATLAGTASSLASFGRWLQEAVPPLQATQSALREQGLGFVSDRLEELEGGLGRTVEALREEVAGTWAPGLQGLADGVGTRIEQVRSRLEEDLIPAVVEAGAAWEDRLETAERALREEAFAAALQQVGRLLEDGYGARDRAGHEEAAGLAGSARLAAARLEALAQEVTEGAAAAFEDGQAVDAAVEQATAALAAAAGHLEGAQEFLASLGFGPAGGGSRP